MMTLDRRAVGGPETVDLFMLDALGNVSSYGSMELPKELDGAQTDLGPVRLTPSPVVVRGFVLDQRGDPIPGACIHRLGASWTRRSSAMLMKSPLWPQYTLSDSDGSFSVAGLPAITLRSVHIVHDGFISQEIIVDETSGDGTLRVVLKRMATNRDG